MRCEKTGRFLTVLLFVILYLAILPACLCAEGKVELGLAAKYPGDKGIDKDAAVLFATGFEEGLDGWWDIRNKDGIKFVDDNSIVHGGSKCLQMTAVKGKDSGADMKHTLSEGVDELYMRFYCRFHKDTIGPHHFIIMGTHVPGWWANAGRRPPGDKGFWTNIEPPTDKRGWEFYTYWHKMRSWNNEDGTANNPPDGDGRSFYGNTFVPDNQPTGLPRDRWICVEIMMKANTIGKSDGEQAFWIDGKKMGHWKPGEPIGSWFRATFHTSGNYNIDPKPFEGYDWRSDPKLKLNHIILQWYISKEHGEKSKVDENIVYFDDIVVATKYIGPRVEGSVSAKKDKPQTPKVDMVRPLKQDPVENLPGVFFFEDFETIKELKESFHNIGGNFNINAKDAAGGKKAIEMAYIPKEQMQGDPGSAGYVGHFFGDNPLTRRIKEKKPYNKVYARWYHKFEEGFEPQPDRGTLPPKMARMRCYGKDWNAIYSVLFWIEGKDGHITIERHTKAPNVHRKWLPNYHTQWGFLNEGNIGRWIHLEMCVSLGQGLRSDRIQAWADGMLICDIANDDLTAGFKELTLNAMQWDCYWNGGSPSAQSRFYDDLVLSTEPIGPLRTGLNPVIVKAAFAGGEGQTQKEWEIEVAQSRQVAVSVAAKGKERTPKMEHTTVWKGSVKSSSNTVRVDSRNGQFIGRLADKGQLANNTLHFVRVRQKSNSGLWSEWSGWHAGFATIWKEDTKPQEKTPPADFLLEHDE